MTMYTSLKLIYTVGDITAPAVTAGGRGFIVEGSDDFLNLAAALGRSCDIQVSSLKFLNYEY
jgi:hypothetical protein